MAIPNRPFSGKPVKIIAGKNPPDGDYREPLTESELKLLRKVVPGLPIRAVDSMPELSDLRLELFLREYYHMGDSRIRTLTWGHIFDACKKYLATQQKEKDRQSRNDKDREIDSETREQAWSDEAPEYVPNAKQQVLKEPAIKARFSFNEAQAFFNGKDLGLPSNKPVLILSRLVDSLGEIVKHKDLDQDSNPSNASDILKGRIRTIKKALKRHKIPYKIIAKRGVGYVLQQAQIASR